MSNWSDILKYKHFSNPKDRLKGALLSLLMLLGVLIMLIDIYGSVADKYTLMIIVELVVIIFVILLYSFFPHIISLKIASFATIGLISMLILASLTIPGYNQEFVLFSMGLMPSILFFFLGAQTGTKWSMVIILLLGVTTLNAHFKWVTPVFTVELLIQVTVAYIAISYFHYAIEKQRNGYEKGLATALKIREVLLKEVHHRAKNNLQIIMGIQESQAFRVEDKACKKILISQRNRLKAMSLIHEGFSKSSTSEDVELKVYLQDIINNFQKFTHHSLIANLDTQILKVSEAMNLGLFLNEALSNSIEHGCNTDRKERIEVSLKNTGEYCTLKVKDFGKGFNFNKKSSSLGLVLMEDISTFFHKGNMMIDYKDGTEVSMRFHIAPNTLTSGYK